MLENIQCAWAAASCRVEPDELPTEELQVKTGRMYSAGDVRLLVLDDDPLTRPASLGPRENVWLVIQHGAPVAGTALERDVVAPG